MAQFRNRRHLSVASNQIVQAMFNFLCQVFEVRNMSLTFWADWTPSWESVASGLNFFASVRFDILDHFFRLPNSVICLTSVF